MRELRLFQGQESTRAGELSLQLTTLNNGYEISVCLCEKPTKHYDSCNTLKLHSSTACEASRSCLISESSLQSVDLSVYILLDLKTE
jgi:hypothetical protein